MPNKAVKRGSLRIEIVVLAIIIAILSSGAYLAFHYSQNLSQQHYNVFNTTNVINALKDLRESVTLAETGQRGYLLTHQEAYLKPYHDSLALLDERTMVVSNLQIEIPLQADRIRHLLDLIDRKMTELANTIALAQNNEERQARKVVLSGLGRQLQEDINQVFNDIEDAEYALLAQQFRDLKAIEAQNEKLFTVFFVAGFLSIVMMLSLLIRIKHKDREYQADLERRALELEQRVEERTQELAIYSEQLTRSNRELEEFAFIASHDLQEPLRKIQAFSNRIKDIYANKLDDKGVDYINRMSKAAVRMSNLISDLLEFSRIKTRGKPFEDLALGELIEQVLEDLEIAITESDAQVTVDDLPTVRGDYSQLSQLFTNLLSNAIKFRDPDKAPVIKLQYRQKEALLQNIHMDCHQILVQDNGIGFDQSYAEKIFLPFQRLHSRDAYAGTGIGLPICRRIVERHGGVIQVQSVLGEGTTFDILFPVDTSAVEEALDQ